MEEKIVDIEKVLGNSIPLKGNNNSINFTKGQELAVKEILEFLAKPFDKARFIAGLIGAGGVGKTFVIKYILTNCNYSASVVTCCSTTHKACRVFSEALGHTKKVFTIQSVFGFRMDLKLEDFDPINPQFAPKASPKIDDTEVLIVDEASMIPASLVGYIKKTCLEKEIKILFVGDADQLPPAKQLKSTAFEICFKKFVLNEIVRQGIKNPILGLLDMLRYDIENNTNRFINYLSTHIGVLNYNENNEGYCILRQTDFTKLVIDRFTNPEYAKNIDLYRMITYTNDAVQAWNDFIRNNIVLDAKKNILTKHDLLMAYETVVDDYQAPIIINSEEYIVNEIVNYVDNTYKFKGFNVRLQAIHGGQITTPLFIIDHTDKYTMLKYHEVVSTLIKDAKASSIGVRSAKWKKYFDFKRKYLILKNIKNNLGTLLYSKDLDYGFAITSHKSQGSTYNCVFVDCMDMIYDKQGIPYTLTSDLLKRLYVACSRAKTELILCYGR